MANPNIPGVSESEQALLYAKLNEYNRGRASFKEAGVYLVVLPDRKNPTTRSGFIRRSPKGRLFFIFVI